jgi:DNA polymerase (family X)
MNNIDIAKILYNIADILELQNIAWKPQAYRNAARKIETLDRDINAVYKEGKLYDLPGIGKHIGEKIEELLNTGKLKYYNKLKKEIKIDIEGLNEIPTLGPKKMKILYSKLKIKNVKDLERAIKKKKLRDLEGFGEETEKNLMHGIKLRKTKPKRFPLKEVTPIAKKIIKVLKVLPSVERIEIAGSYRRKKETVGDLDILVMSTQAPSVMKTFIALPNIVKIIAKGPTKSSISLNNGLQVDLRVVKKKEYGAALLYFTGSKEHGVALRRLALKKGWTLNEYALTELKTKKWIAGKTEEEIYKKLGLKFIKPEKRDGFLKS